MHGVDSATLEALCAVANKHPKITKIILYGSRAAGGFKETSDVDIALCGDLTPPEIWGIAGFLNDETLVPLDFDVVHFDTLTNEKLKKNIENHGKILFERAEK